MSTPIYYMSTPKIRYVMKVSESCTTERKVKYFLTDSLLQR
jgi:hypothetical protein